MLWITRLSMLSHNMQKVARLPWGEIMDAYIVVSSITYAYKGQSLLERKGCTAYIERAPAHLSKCGCHYLLRIHGFPLDRARQILRQGNVRIISAEEGRP